MCPLVTLNADLKVYLLKYMTARDPLGAWALCRSSAAYWRWSLTKDLRESLDAATERLFAGLATDDWHVQKYLHRLLRDGVYDERGHRKLASLLCADAALPEGPPSWVMSKVYGAFRTIDDPELLAYFRMVTSHPEDYLIVQSVPQLRRLRYDAQRNRKRVTGPPVKVDPLLRLLKMFFPRSTQVMEVGGMIRFRW
jgi:hypothetical protein